MIVAPLESASNCSGFNVLEIRIALTSLMHDKRRGRMMSPFVTSIIMRGG